MSTRYLLWLLGRCGVGRHQQLKQDQDQRPPWGRHPDRQRQLQNSGGDLSATTAAPPELQLQNSTGPGDGGVTSPAAPDVSQSGC